jgi:hypothetical protein
MGMELAFAETLVCAERETWVEAIAPVITRAATERRTRVFMVVLL